MKKAAYWIVIGIGVGIVQPALAYLGPGGAVSAIGSALALVAAVVIAIIGFLWFPIKRAWRAMRSRKQPEAQLPDAPAGAEAASGNVRRDGATESDSR